MCIMGLTDNEDRGDESELCLNAIDRGGMWHVNDSMYILFAIAKDVRRFCTTRKIVQLQESEIITYVLKHRDIIFQCCLLTAP